MELAGWQRTNIQTAARYLRERMTAGDVDAKTKAVYDLLIEVLDPTRRVVRLQREAALTAASVPVASARERRAAGERRAADRRRTNLASSIHVDRRSGTERRTGRERRNR